MLAAQICVEYHYEQLDKAGNPYYLHPFAVASKCKNEKEIIVALLHDILEYTDYPDMDILFHNIILSCATGIYVIILMYLSLFSFSFFQICGRINRSQT